jgi:hypothetical protein
VKSFHIPARVDAIGSPPDIFPKFTIHLPTAPMEQNQLQAFHGGRIQTYSEARLVETLQAYRERPHLAPDQPTHIQLSLCGFRDPHRAPTIISVYPVAPARFPCQVQLGFCCSLNLPDYRPIYDQIWRFLHTDFPQVHWDPHWGIAWLDHGPAPSNWTCDAKAQWILDQFSSQQTSVLGPSPIPSILNDRISRATATAVDRISKGLYSKLSLCGLPPLRVRKGLKLEEYPNLTFDHARQLGKENSIALLALRLIGGCCQSLFIAATSAGDPLPAWDESQDRGPNTKDSHWRKCWEARACILNTVAAVLLPIWGHDAYRIYSAALGKWITLAGLSRLIGQQLQGTC